MHTVRSMKCYAVLESTVQIDGSVDEIVEYLRQQKFRGDIQVNMNQGGITNVTSREHIPLTLEQLEMVCKKA